MRKHISPATTISLIALFFSLTGAGFAASHYLLTSTRQIAPSVLHELQGRDGPRGFTGPQGIQGPQGQQGWNGETGSPGLLNWNRVYRVNASTGISPTQPRSIAMICNPNDHLIAGGFSSENAIVTESRPDLDSRFLPIGWIVTAHVDPAAPPEPGNYATVEAWALCYPGAQ